MKRLEISTEKIHSNHPMSYGFLVKALDDVSVELLNRFDIPQTSGQSICVNSNR